MTAFYRRFLILLTCTLAILLLVAGLASVAFADEGQSSGEPGATEPVEPTDPVDPPSPSDPPDDPPAVTYTTDLSVDGLYDMDDYGNYVVSSRQDPSRDRLEITKAGGKKRISLHEYYRASDGSVSIDVCEHESSWEPIDVTYTSEQPSVISVDPTGVVTAHENSSTGVTINIQASYHGQVFNLFVNIYASGQDGSSGDEVEIPPIPSEVTHELFSGISVAGLYGVDNKGKWTGSPIADRTISTKGGSLRILLGQRLRNSTTVRYEDDFRGRWQDIHQRYYSEQPNVISVDGAGNVTAHADSGSKGVTIHIFGDGGLYTSVVVYAANQDGSGGGSGGGGGGGSGGGGSGGDTPEDPVVDIPDIPAEVTNPIISGIRVSGLYETNAYGDWVGSPVDNTITLPGGKLRIMLEQDLRSNGKTIRQDDLLQRWTTINQRFFSSNPSLISVDNSGVITAHANCPQGVTIHIFGDGGLYTSVLVYATNQLASDVVSVTIIDADGNPIGKNDTSFDKNSSSRYLQLYARVVFVDGSVRSTLPSAADFDGNFNEPRLNKGRLSWQVNNEDVGYVNAQSGRFKVLDDGLVKVMATCGSKTGYIWININTGKYADAYNPSDSLTIKVVYEADESKVYSEKTYSVAEVSSWGLFTADYTLTQADGKYVSDRAQGVPLTTVCEQAGVIVDEVTGFRLVANDGANPGFLGRAMLFDTTRYFFPNYDLGGSFQGAIPVQTMLAIADNWTPNSLVEPDDALNGGTCFRLVFGSVGRSDGLTNKSLKYINTLIIVMRGAAPTGGGDGEGDGDGSGSGSGRSGTAAGSDLNSASQKGTNNGGGEGGTRWQVFQMMKKEDSQIEDVQVKQHILPFVIAAILLFIAGGLYTWASYRDELKRPTFGPDSGPGSGSGPPRPAL